MAAGGSSPGLRRSRSAASRVPWQQRPGPHRRCQPPPPRSAPPASVRFLENPEPPAQHPPGTTSPPAADPTIQGDTAGNRRVAASPPRRDGGQIRSCVGCPLTIRLITQTILLDQSGAVWTDGPSNVSRPDPSGAIWSDAGHPARKLEGRRFGSDLGRHITAATAPMDPLEARRNRACRPRREVPNITPSR
jgi:hypothetical protein